MKNSTKSHDLTLYTVVFVASGIPASVQVFLKRREAEKLARHLRSESRPEYDEIAIFESKLSGIPFRGRAS
ncbi:MAG: hypothetical protein M1378_00470 [Bacteroidetes bacterium]|nr:hypothetical protein [Bacteroidota bacterium]